VKAPESEAGGYAAGVGALALGAAAGAGAGALAASGTGASGAQGAVAGGMLGVMLTGVGGLLLEEASPESEWAGVGAKAALVTLGAVTAAFGYAVLRGMGGAPAASPSSTAPALPAAPAPAAPVVARRPTVYEASAADSGRTLTLHAGDRIRVVLGKPSAGERQWSESGGLVGCPDHESSEMVETDTFTAQGRGPGQLLGQVVHEGRIHETYTLHLRVV